MTQDMTQGKIMPMLVHFTIPLVLGNLFQLTYNAVDSIIVGHFVGKEALAAVGICNPITTLFILFLNGLCMGASILIGMYYGAKDNDKLSRQMSTTLLAGLVFSLVLTLICIFFSPQILQFMQVDPSILSMTTTYLQIIFAGLVFTFLYNFFASTLRALGDSKSPLYFLIISAILNIFGDLFFVVVLHAGSQGCAISTVISEALCCLFCILYIQKKVPLLQLGKKWLVFDISLLKRTIAYGWASAMQQLSAQEIRQFKHCILHIFAEQDYASDWTQQYHYGAIRDNNSLMYDKLGADTGFDSIGEFTTATAMSHFLNELNKEGKLTRTILYCLNPCANEVIATMLGNFQDGSCPGKIQFGSGWWFNDQLDGMTRQMNALSVLGLLSRFVGMLTDSRSFLSYPRHEYFRRLLCNLLGNDVEKGLLPNDMESLSRMVEDISYNNARNYFKFY